MPKKKSRPDVHHVTAHLDVLELARAGSALKLKVYRRDKKLGEIIVSRGSFTWYGHKWKRPVEWNWHTFAKLMDREADPG